MSCCRRMSGSDVLLCAHMFPLWWHLPAENPTGPFLGGHFWLCWYCVCITHLAHHLGRQRSLIARHLCLYVKGHVSLGICVWLTHGFEGGVFVESNCAVVALRVRKPLSKWSEGCVVQVVLFWWGRIRPSGIYSISIRDLVFSMTEATRLISEVRVMLFIFSISDDAGVTWLPPTRQYCCQLLPPSWLDWDLSPGAMCAPAVQSITGLKWPRGTWGWGSKAPDSEYENLFLICDWLFWVIVGLRADEQCSAARKQLIWQLTITKKTKGKTEMRKKKRWQSQHDYRLQAH